MAQVRHIAQALRYKAYFHEQIDKDSIIERFRQGQQPVIVATSALGIGIDIPDIRSIIYLGRPRTILDYGQENKRTGRDGQYNNAVIIVPDPEPELP